MYINRIINSTAYSKRHQLQFANSFDFELIGGSKNIIFDSSDKLWRKVHKIKNFSLLKYNTFFFFSLRKILFKNTISIIPLQNIEDSAHLTRAWATALAFLLIQRKLKIYQQSTDVLHEPFVNYCHFHLNTVQDWKIKIVGKLPFFFFFF